MSAITKYDLMPKFILFIILVLFSFNLKAQTWEIGGALGGAGYMGDLNANNPVKISGPAVGGFIKRNFDGHFSVRGSATLGKIEGEDSHSSDPQFRARNLSFRTSLQELSLTGEFNFLDYIPDAGKNKFTPYLFFGGAAAHYFPYATYEGKSYSLRGKRTEGETKNYSTTTISFPYGAGIKYNIIGKFTLGAEIGYRNTNTDYLDDVSGVYADKARMNAISKALSDRSGENTGVYIGTPGTQRGDLRPHDTYFFTQITLSFTFVTEKCYFAR
jgi:opacity protein-like surface antigen